MNQPMNGSGEAQVTLTVIKSMIPRGNGAKIIYTLSNGQFVGSIDFDIAHPQFFKMMGAEFQQFCAEQGGTIQIPSGVDASKLRA